MLVQPQQGGEVLERAPARVKYEYHDVTTDEVKELVGYSDYRYQVVVEPSSHGGSVVWRGRGKAAAELIGIKSMMRDMGWDTDIKLHVDATVAQAMANRQGIGKIRHLEVRYLGLQEMAKSGVIAVRKMNGVLNPADMLTKPMSFSEMLGKLGHVHLRSDLGLQSRSRGGVDTTYTSLFSAQLSLLLSHATQCIQPLVDLFGSSCKTVIPLTLSSLEHLKIICRTSSQKVVCPQEATAQHIFLV